MRVFVTGASGWIGSAVVPELLEAGHDVVGLARSDQSAQALAAAGVAVEHGGIDDLDTLGRAASDADAVIHLAFMHDTAFSGGFETAVAADRRAIETFADALAGSGRPLMIASGTLGITPGRLLTERDGIAPVESPAAFGGAEQRLANAQFTLALAARGIRTSIVRLSPTVHGEGDHGFVPRIIDAARQAGVSAYVGDGSARWPAVHRFDAARLICLGIESAPAGSALHAVADEGVPMREIAEVIGSHLGVPVRSLTPEEAPGHFAWLAGFVSHDSPASSALTRELLGWEPTWPGLIADLGAGHYFRVASAAAN